MSIMTKSCSMYYLLATMMMTMAVVFHQPTVTLAFAFRSSSPLLPATSSSSQLRSPTALAMGLTLYGHQGSRSPLVNWGAYELGLPFTMGDLRENPHPFGQLPCLVNDDTGATLFESGAILLYLNTLVSNSESSEAQKAEILSWVTWANASLDPICFLETPEGKVYDTGLKKPNRRMDRLNDLLSNRKFLIDDNVFTVADVAVASYLLYALQFFPSVNLSRWPHVVRFMKEAASRPNYAKAFGANVQSSLLQVLTDMEGKPNKILGMF